MENIMDKMEHFVARRFHLIMIAALVITMIHGTAPTAGRLCIWKVRRFDQWQNYQFSRSGWQN